MPLDADLRVLNAPPNWAGGYTVRYNFKTDIGQSRSGDEQRIALRQIARKEIEFSVLRSRNSFQDVGALLTAWQGKRFLIPELTQSIRTVASLPPSGLLIAIEDSPPHWFERRYPLVLVSGSTIGWRTGLDIEGSVLQVEAGEDDVTWPAGTLVCPGRIVRIPPTQSFRTLTSGVLDSDLIFAVEPGSEEDVDYFYTGRHPEQTFHGVELFLMKPNWLHTPQRSIEIIQDSIDYETGVDAHFNPADFNVATLRQTFLGRTREEAQRFVDLFHRMKGRRGSFYAPTWTDDMRLFSVNDNRLVIEGTDIIDLFGSDLTYRNVAVRTKTGVVPLGITGYEIINDRSVLSVDGTIAFAPPDVLGVSWLLMWRFASDSLTINWRTDRVAEFEATFHAGRDSFFEIVVGGYRLMIGGDYVTVPEPSFEAEGDVLTIGGKKILVDNQYLFV